MSCSLVCTCLFLCILCSYCIINKLLTINASFHILYFIEFDRYQLLVNMFGCGFCVAYNVTMARYRRKEPASNATEDNVATIEDIKS